MQTTSTKPHTRNEKILLIAMILSMCTWGTSWTCAKVLGTYTSALNLSMMRFILVPLTLIPLTYFAKIKVNVNKKGWFHVAGASIFILLYTLFFFRGVHEGFPGAGGVLVTTINPIFAYIIGLVISKILPSKQEYLGLLFGFLAGMVLLKVWDNTAAILDVGNIYFLLAAFVWAVMSKISSHANKFGNAIGFSLWTHILAALIIACFVDFKELKQLLITADTKFWLNILYFGVVNSALATTCFLYVTARIGAEKASTYIFIVPSTAVLTSFIFIGEQILWNTVVGGVLGILAVFIINGKFNRKKKKKVNVMRNIAR
ncbi:DMT family transporter [Wenyingzhuangia marina]|uniref:Permease of the drug/metabolite transporter (DMT) superfamily n=1 Tax=Wenyingzhuangia marina TaxID=1195760 RepID=A0A1M5WQ27_9FLAO|nr:DMT family transporter [Wenyingzhuangia marina]GGF79878.1 membrane protein [Wenyingzhuangia marina]SHH89581.1 Permease of the drug/metabolite transporter (DMT) superfamily [Wenyingzhuangia marina]